MIRPESLPIPADAAADDAPLPVDIAVRRLIRQSNRVALGTLQAVGGLPYVSLAGVATDFDGSPLMLLSRLAEHRRNIEADPHVALLFDGTAGFANPQEGPRVTILGWVEPCAAEQPRRRFLARHPGASLYAGFADFMLFRVQMDRAHWVGGFARAVWLDGGLHCAEPLAREFALAEGDILAHMNEDHGDVLVKMANRLIGLPGDGWRMVGIDPDGCDLANGETVARLAFDRTLETVSEVRPALIDLIKSADKKA
jgi:putative heme iron utilization protein